MGNNPRVVLEDGGRSLFRLGLTVAIEVVVQLRSRCVAALCERATWLPTKLQAPGNEEQLETRSSRPRKGFVAYIGGKGGKPNGKTGNGETGQMDLAIRLASSCEFDGLRGERKRVEGKWRSENDKRVWSKILSRDWNIVVGVVAQGREGERGFGSEFGEGWLTRWAAPKSFLG